MMKFWEMYVKVLVAELISGFTPMLQAPGLEGNSSVIDGGGDVATSGHDGLRPSVSGLRGSYHPPYPAK